MSDYCPDRWVVLEFKSGDLITRKVFGGWYGGYTGGDSWKLNSGITEVRVKDGVYEFDGYSGSTYVCHENNHGMSGFQMGILAGWIKQAAERGDYEIREIALEDVTVS